jgi:hypothetical protein
MADEPDNEVIVSRAVKPRVWHKPLEFIRKNLKSLLIALAVVAVAFLLYGYMHTKNQLNHISDSNNGGKTETQQITNTVGRALQLPNETPTLATVNDASKLNSQVFFRNAQNGDKVLIYAKSGRAMLYRPSTKKVIEYSLVDFGKGQ